jgi:hypothetical protein
MSNTPKTTWGVLPSRTMSNSWLKFGSVACHSIDVRVFSSPYSWDTNQWAWRPYISHHRNKRVMWISERFSSPNFDVHIILMRRLALELEYVIAAFQVIQHFLPNQYKKIRNDSQTYLNSFDPTVHRFLHQRSKNDWVLSIRLEELKLKFCLIFYFDIVINTKLWISSENRQ